MQNIIKRVIRILVSGYIVKMIRNLISKNSNDSNKTITNRNIKTELISNSVLYCPLPKIFFCIVMHMPIAQLIELHLWYVSLIFLILNLLKY